MRKTGASMSDSDKKAKEFHEAMIGIYKTALEECKYRPTRFLQMVTEHGGVEAAKTLINATEVSEGFTRLWECGRLDLAVEAHAIKPKFAELFTKEEKNISRQRLKEYGYCVEEGER